MRKYNFLTGVLTLAMLLGGCSGSTQPAETTVAVESTTVETTAAETTTEEETTTEAVPVDQSLPASDEYVKALGRTYWADGTGVRWLTYSGSGIEFTVTGKSLSFMLYGDGGALNSNETNATRYAIYMDGERIIDQQMRKGAEEVEVFSGDEEKTATIRLVKLSECANGGMGIKLINVGEGTIEPTENKDLYIEFIGDSITCGYGVDDEDKTHSFKTSTEDCTKAYAYKTAELLDADYSLVSISGYGIVSGYTGTGEKSEKQIIPNYYETLGFSYNSVGGFKPEDLSWDFSTREPDAIVINLGTNDNSYTGNDEERIAEYHDGYVEFLKTVREDNPDAQIVCTLGLMGDSLYSTIEQAVADYSAETGDKNVTAFHLDPITADEGYAADWHPTEATHTRAAEAMAEELKSVLGL